MQLSRPGTHGSRATPDGSSRACLIAAARLSAARSSQRRRSTAISVPSSAIGRPATASRKFFLYWNQSQTTRSVDRSADEAQTASMIGPSAERTAADSRSFLTGRRSTSIACRLARSNPGLGKDAGHRLLVPGDEQVHPGHARYLGELLHGL